MRKHLVPRASKLPGLLFLAFALFFLVFLLFLIGEYPGTDIRKEDCIYREYTLVRVTATRAKHPRYLIEVQEEDAPLSTSHLVHGILRKNGLESLAEGERLLVYVTGSDREDCSYQAMELQTAEKPLLSFEEAVHRERVHVTIGLVLCPFLILCSLVMGIVSLRKSHSDQTFMRAVLRTEHHEK